MFEALANDVFAAGLYDSGTDKPALGSVTQVVHARTVVFQIINFLLGFRRQRGPAGLPGLGQNGVQLAVVAQGRFDPFGGKLLPLVEPLGKDFQEGFCFLATLGLDFVKFFLRFASEAWVWVMVRSTNSWASC